MSGRRAAADKARTRRRLVAAAERRFLRNGFHATSLAEIAAEAGVTTGAVYASFAGKDDLFLAAYEEMVASRSRAIDEAVAAGGSARAASQWLSVVDEEPSWFPLVIEFWAHAVRDDELRERFAVPFGAVGLALGRHLDSAELGTIAKALGNGLALERRANPESVPDELVERAFELLLAGAETHAPR
jgi:AcrR family transcriptional regulator